MKREKVFRRMNYWKNTVEMTLFEKMKFYIKKSYII